MFKNKGQSFTETAIFGMLIITAFSFVIMFSERINRQQSYIMQCFRETLQEARSLNGAVSHLKIADRRMPNVSAPMTLGSQETFSSSNNVMWANTTAGLSKSSSSASINGSPSASSGTTPTIQQTTIATYDQRLTKSAGVNPVSTKTLTATDTLVEYGGTYYLGPGGKYSANSDSILYRSGLVGSIGRAGN